VGRLSTRSALVALLLLAPVPTIGVTAALLVAPGPVGHGIFTACKVWISLFPAAWYLLVERGRPSWSRPTRSGILIGCLSGVAIGSTILIGFWTTVHDRVDPALVREAARGMKLVSPPSYLLAAAGWTLINSLMEEYVYRWFMLRQLRMLSSTTAAAVISALIFTTHHVIAVSVYLGTLEIVLASSGVFFGGLLWAWLYLRFRSIWPSWISHVLADVAVFVVGWYLLFG
jgi:membrane protease YdiL (CAAX protease family)